MPKKFIWLLDSCYPRKGPKLEKDKEHLVGDYPPDVVETWVKTKAAKYVETEPKKKETDKK